MTTTKSRIFLLTIESLGFILTRKKNKLKTKAALVIQRFKIITPEFAY